MDDPTPDGEFDPTETDIAEIRAAFASSTLTAERLTAEYVARIDEYDDTLNAVLTLNEGAKERARELDRRFEEDGFVGPLHGIPTIVKDNHDTADMPTTAGASALEGTTPSRDAAVVERLRDAGAVILGKANLQELSFGVDTVSSLGGATRNPYDTDRRPSGSSGGTAVAVASNLAAIGTGTDTCSSVRSPPAFTNTVGVRPTMGLVSRTGIVPLSMTQDTAGPITRTVADAARTLDAMVGYDPADPITATGVGNVPDEGYTAHLDPDGLNGARIGVLRHLFEPANPDEVDAESAAAVEAAIDDAIDEIGAAGATVVDDVELVDPEYADAARVVGHECKRDFDRYLAERDDPPVGSLRELVESGTMEPSVADRFEESGILDVDVEGLEDDADYLRALARRDGVRRRVLQGFVEHDLDAALYPPSTVVPVEIPESQPFAEMRCELAAHAGLPSIVVQAGFTDDGIPVGFELIGRPFDEPRLFELASGYEHAVEPRRPPSIRPHDGKA